jgi:DNA-directed RNA polymerase subunit omega
LTDGAFACRQVDGRRQPELAALDRPRRPLKHLDILRGTNAMATIDDLLARVDSKYTLVHLAAVRAREINNYYHSLGEGIGQYVRPLVEQVDSNKPLSIAMEEIAADKIVVQRPDEARARAAEALAADEDGEVVSLPQGEDAIIDDADDAPTEI